MARGSRHLVLVAAALAVVLSLPGCEIMGAPMPLKPAENVGVDPTGETIDTSTLPPDDGEAAEPPRTAAAPRKRPAPAPEQDSRQAAEKTSQPQTGMRKTVISPQSGSDTSVRVGTSGQVHHRRKRSRND